MTHRIFLALPGLLLLACSTAPTAPTEPIPDTLTREQIAQRRQEEDARYDRELRACYQRFAVNDCRREVLARHREVTHALRALELQWNARQREERTRSLQSQPHPVGPGDTP